MNSIVRIPSKALSWSIFALTILVPSAIDTATVSASTSTITVTKGQRSPVIGIADGGQFITNKPGGYYMGFIALGESFTRNSLTGRTNACEARVNRSVMIYRGRNCSDYLFGLVNNSCMWVGPKTAVRDLRVWWSSSTAGVGNVCSGARRRLLENPYNVGHMFNCWAGNARNHYDSAGEWPSGATPLSAERMFYRGATWVVNPSDRRQYLIASLKDPILNLAPGTRVQYRYSTLDDGFNVVYLGGYGWGFIQSGALDLYSRAIRGRWTSPGNTGWPRRTCRRDY